MTVPTEAPEACLTFNVKIMTVRTEAQEACLLFNVKIMAVRTEAPKTCLVFNVKIMTFQTEAPGNLPTIQWQDNDCYVRSTSIPAYYSIQR